MADKIFKFVTKDWNLNPSNLAPITAEEIMAMPREEFLVFKDRLYGVIKRTRWFTMIYQPVLIKAGTEAILFRGAENEQQVYGTSDTDTYRLTRRHTNMSRKGEFAQNSLNIIYDIAAKKAFFSGRGTTLTGGLVTNPKATFPANFDPFLTLDTWIESVELSYREDGQVIAKDLLCAFPQNDGQSGAIGAAAGGIAQNALFDTSPLRNVRVLEGGEDFDCVLRHASDFDASTATGIDMYIAQKIELKTLEMSERKI